MSSHFKINKVEKTPEAEAVIFGELTLEFLNECRAEAVKELNDHTNLPGFRAGKIPEEMLVKTVGEMRVLEETAEVALGREYGPILKEASESEKLSPIGRPQVAITKLAPGIPLEFKITIALEPEFVLPDYHKIAKEVTETDKEKKRIKIVEDLVKATEIKIPKIIIESELEKMVGQFKDDVTRSGLKWEDYLTTIKKSEVEIRDEWRPKALERGKAELIVSKIAEREMLEPEADKLEGEAKHILEHYPEADPLRVRLFVYQTMRNQKVLEFLEGLK
jgi:FKBP-type peptidyl-prolyl cis-trans isomerase (trigger factor)